MLYQIMIKWVLPIVLWTISKWNIKIISLINRSINPMRPKTKMAGQRTATTASNIHLRNINFEKDGNGSGMIG